MPTSIFKFFIAIAGKRTVSRDVLEKALDVPSVIEALSTGRLRFQGDKVLFVSLNAFFFLQYYCSFCSWAIGPQSRSRMLAIFIADAD